MQRFSIDYLACHRIRLPAVRNAIIKQINAVIKENQTELIFLTVTDAKTKKKIKKAAINLLISKRRKTGGTNIKKLRHKIFHS